MPRDDLPAGGRSPASSARSAEDALAVGEENRETQSMVDRGGLTFDQLRNIRVAHDRGSLSPEEENFYQRLEQAGMMDLAFLARKGKSVQDPMTGDDVASARDFMTRRGQAMLERDPQGVADRTQDTAIEFGEITGSILTLHVGKVVSALATGRKAKKATDIVTDAVVQ